ncbi:unnamed protein product [Urochloa decumbens]|uniref:ABC-2 type transporter transmembrane domain-containing protein n=1 Tax=Urochloa decumbens TaxID=240449 RepID=A0ABC8ZZR0_9POAL
MLPDLTLLACSEGWQAALLEATLNSAPRAGPSFYVPKPSLCIIVSALPIAIAAVAYLLSPECASGSLSAAPCKMAGAADFHVQADALFRKNLAIQRRAYKTNCCIILFPLLVCGLLGAAQTAIDNFFKGAGGGADDCKRCAAARISEAAVGGLSCPMECPLPVAPRWPVALLLPGDNADDATKDDRTAPPAAPGGAKGEEESPEEILEPLTKPLQCRSPESCAAPARFLVTGGNKSFAETYDLTNSDIKKFNMIVQYNPEKSNILRVPRLMNLASNAYLQLRGNNSNKMRFGFVKDMPRDGHPMKAPDISFLVGKLVFVWIVMLLFPVILSSLVYEKQQKLRAMMKMHGLGDMAYWIISYCYFLLISLIYMLLLVIFGSIVGVKLFASNSYVLQFIIYFTYMNLQISFAFLMTSYFTTVTTSTVTGYLYVIGSGFIGEYLFKPFVEDTSVSRSLIMLMEFFPPFSLYRIIYELSPPPATGFYSDFSGVQLGDLSDPENGILVLLIIMVLEWVTFLFLTLYLDDFGCLQNGIRKLLTGSRPDGSGQTQKLPTQPQEFEASIEIDRTDIMREREIVDRFLQQPDNTYSVIIDNIRKVYPPKDGNAEKVAVKGFSLSIQRGQCFGLLGSNGAGKTSLISMLTGFTKPTSGTAYIDGLNIQTDMSEIYTRIGVCPQFDLLWETLTGREHLMFYGRLKRLNGAALVELKAKYGGTFVFTVTAAANEDGAVEQLVRSISSTAKRTYHIAGTQKFEMPKHGVKISDVFQAMEQAKHSLNIVAWGLVDTTLEDVFIKVAKESEKCPD